MKITSTRQYPDRQYKINGMSVCTETGNTSYIVCLRARLGQSVLKIWHNLRLHIIVKTKKIALIKNVMKVKRKNNLKILHQIAFTH